MNLHPTRCLVCGAKEATPVYRYDSPDVYERTVGVDAEAFARAWVRCDECGFHYSQYSRDPEAIDRIYDEAYRATDVPWRQRSVRDTFDCVTALPFEQSETKQRVRWIKDQLDTMGGKNGNKVNGTVHRFLDVGGGNAIFAHEFSDNHWRPSVVDPSSEGEALCRTLGIDYTCAALESAAFAHAYDLIAMTYVLEHLRDPARALRIAHRHLAGDGALYIEVPDVACFADLPQDHDIFNACHLWMFSAGDLSRLLWTCGFEPIAEETAVSPRGHHALKLMAVPA